MSKTKTILKYYTSLLLFISCNSFCDNRIKNEIHLIPDKYIGEIIIVFQDEEKADMLKEDNKRLYIIPNSGVLISGFEPNEGWIDTARLEFYYADSLLNRIERIRYTSWPFMDTLSEGDAVSVSSLEYYTIGFNEFKDVTYLWYRVDTLSNISSVYKRDWNRDVERIRTALTSLSDIEKE